MDMEPTVSLTELLAAVMQAWKQICITLLMFALLFGGYQAYRQIARMRDPENSQEKIEERYQTALEEYETQKEELQRTLASQEKNLAAKEEYLENSILMQINPYDKYISDIVFTFSDIDESAQLFRYPNTSADYLPKKIRSQYIELWNSVNAAEDIGLSRYANVAWKYLSELISVSSLDGELLSIQAVGATSAEAEELAEAVYAFFEAHQNVIGKGSAQHTFVLMNRTTKNVIDEALETRYESLETEIETLKENITQSNQAIEDLEAPEREQGYSIAVMIQAVVRYAILGAVAGIFLAGLIVCCRWIFSNRAADSFQLERAIQAPFWGSLKIPNTLVEHLTARVMEERVWKNREQAAAYISEQVRASLPKEEKILLLSTLPESKAGSGMGELVSILSKDGYAVIPVMDAVHNPKAVEMLRTCTAVMFAEMAWQSSIPMIRNSVVQIKHAKKPVSGIVLI